jgi:hypothetical protein
MCRFAAISDCRQCTYKPIVTRDIIQREERVESLSYRVNRGIEGKLRAS